MNDNTDYYIKINEFMLKLFNFRLNNIKLLLDKEYIQKIYQIIPIIKIQKEEFESFKYYILKNLSLNGEFILRNPDLFKFKEDFFSSVRYENSPYWNRFNILGHYSGDIYEYINRYSIFCEDLIKTSNIDILFEKKNQFHNIQYPNHSNFIYRKYTKIESIEFFYYHDLDYRDYNTDILKNIFNKKKYENQFLKKKTFSTSLGFYKAFFIVFFNKHKECLTNDNVIKILKIILKLEKKKLSISHKNPIIFPWMIIEDVRKFIGELDGIRRLLEKIP